MPERDWFDGINEFIVARRGLSTALLLGGIAACVAAPRAFRAVSEAKADDAAGRAAVHAHISWLEAMTPDQKRRWPVTGICRPSSSPYGKCDCDSYGDEVKFLEVLPGGDVACHETR